MTIMTQDNINYKSVVNLQLKKKLAIESHCEMIYHEIEAMWSNDTVLTSDDISTDEYRYRTFKHRL